MNNPHLNLYWVTVTARHNTDPQRKRFAALPVWASSVVDAAREPIALDVMVRLLHLVNPMSYYEEVRVYHPGQDGGDGLPAYLYRIDGVDVPGWDGEV